MHVYIYILYTAYVAHVHARMHARARISICSEVAFWPTRLPAATPAAFTWKAMGQHRGLPAVTEGGALAVVHVAARAGLSGPPGDSAGTRGQDQVRQVQGSPWLQSHKGQ